MPTDTNAPPTWEATESIEPTWEETEEISEPTSGLKPVPFDAKLNLTPYQKAAMEGRDTGMWGEGPMAIARGQPSGGGEATGAIAKQFAEAPVKTALSFIKKPIELGERGLVEGVNALVRGSPFYTPPQPIFGESPEEFERRKRYPLGAPGEPLYQPSFDPTQGPTDVQKLLSGFSTPEAILTLPLGVTKTGARVLLASMLPDVAENIRSVAAGEGSQEEKMDRIRALAVPAILGLMGTRPKGAGVLPERLESLPVDYSTEQPITLTGGEALINRPRGFTPAARPVPRAAEPVGPPVPRRGLPIDMPETAGQVHEDVISEIRRRGAHTRAEIAELFPNAQKPNEFWADLRDRAWPGEAEERIIQKTSAPPEQVPPHIAERRLDEMRERAGLEDMRPPPKEPPTSPPVAPVKPTPPPAPAAPAAAAEKPPVARLEPDVPGKTKNKLGDPLGTTYHATAEDWAAWQDLQKLPVKEKFARAGEIEAIKNKYGGMPPAAPKEAAAPTGPKTAQEFADLPPEQWRAWRDSIKYNEPTAAEVTKDFTADDVETLKKARDDQVKIITGLNKEILEALQTKDEARLQKISEKLQHHGLKAQTLNEFVRAVEARKPTAAPAPPAEPAPAAPAAPPAPAEPLWMDKPLSFWEQVAAKLPVGDLRATLAKSLGVPNQPAKIIQHIKRRVAEIRARSAEPPKPVAPSPEAQLDNNFKSIEAEIKGATGSLSALSTLQKRIDAALKQEQITQEQHVFLTDRLSERLKGVPEKPTPKPFEEGQPQQPPKPATKTPAPTPPPAEKPLPPVAAQPLSGPELEAALKIPVTDTTEAKARVQAIDSRRRELVKKRDELDAEIKRLKPQVVSSRGWNKGRVKASAKAADLTKLRAAEKDFGDLSRQIQSLDETAQPDKNLIDEASSAAIINDPKQPLLRRLDRRIRAYGQQPIPPELLAARDAETARVIREQYPDATDAEVKRMAPEVQRGMYFGGDFWKDPAIPKPQDLRAAHLAAAINAPDVPSNLFPQELTDELNRYNASKRTYGGKVPPGAPIDPLAAGKAEELAGKIKTASEQIRARLAEEEKARAAAVAADEAKQEQLLDEAQNVADSAKRPGTKGGRSASDVKLDLIARIKGAIDELIASDQVKLTRTDQPDSYSVESKSSQGFGWFEKTEKGKYKVSANTNGGKFVTTVDSPEEAEWVIKAMAARGVGKAVIGVPGDGVFRLNRDGASMLNLWDKAHGIDTSGSRAPGYKSGGGAQKPPGAIKTEQDWRDTLEYHGLEDWDKIYDWSPSLRAFAEKVNPEAPEKVTVLDAQKWINDTLEKKRKAAQKPPEVPPGAAGPGSPAYGQGPDNEVLGLDLGSPTWNKIQRQYQNFFGGLGQLFKRREVKQDLQSLSNAADNLPRIAGLRAGDSIRVRATEQERNALTFVMQALKMSGEGLSEDNVARLGEFEFLGDPTGYLQTKQADMETLAQQFKNEGKKLEAQAALEASQAMRYARENFNRLKPIAQLAKRKFDRQIQREQANGIDVAYENWYVPQRHEIDLIPHTDRPIILGEGRGGGPAGAFKKAKVYEDYASAIEAGFIPRTFDLAKLIEHRVATGERLITGRGFYDAMREIPDPVDGKPIVMDIPRRVITRPDGTPDVQETIPIGYTKQQVMGGASVAVHNGYRRLVDALTSRSQLAESAVVGTLQNIAAVEKHLMLALDTFHASRTMQAELALTGKVSLGARQRLGRALVEYSVGDLDAAVNKGEITQEMADYIRTPQQMEVNGQQTAISPHALLNLGIRNGLNIARWGDALYNDWLRNMPVTGEVNKWVFDKLTRSAVAHGFLAEFERVAKSRPEMNGSQVARKVASDINVMFGNLGKQSIFRNPSLRSITQVLFLAPQWVESLARREGRVALQLGEAVIKGRSPGTVGKGIGTGLAAYFVATQALNLITRGHLTFQNQEQGHKLDAWIPGGANGFFISPLSVFGEITHDILRYAQTKPDLASAIAQVGANKLGNLGRFLEVVALGRDPLTSEKIIGTGRRAVQAGIQLAPVPITLSQGLRTIGAAVAPGVVSPPPPGGLQRQALASAGLKTEPVGTAQNQIYQMANDWKRHSGNAKYEAEVERRLKEDFGPSDYKDLRAALTRGDVDQARAAYQELRQSGKTPKTIRQTMQHPHPFTGSQVAERRFRDSLKPADRETYNKALEERRDLYHRFQEMLRTERKPNASGQ